MGIRENYYPENLALNIGPVSFWDKYFFPQENERVNQNIGYCNKVGDIKLLISYTGVGRDL